MKKGFAMVAAVLVAGVLWGADRRPIGVFDSGTGGLTVLEKMLTDDFAHEKFVYFGDQANMPYGDYAAAGKSEFLKGLVIKDAEFLLSKGAKVIVIACNTATAYGYDAVADLLAKRGDGTRVVGVVNAGARAAIARLDLVRKPEPCAIGVLATPGTIASGVYARTIERELKKLGVTAEVRVFSRGCAGLADAVERGSKDAPKIACDNLKALMAEHAKEAPHLPLRAVILGCTHFPFVQRELEAAAPKGLCFIDPAVFTAAECAAVLKEQDRRTDAVDEIAVDTYVSVAAPGLAPDKLDAKGGLTRAWKYGRTDAASDRSTVPVTIAEATGGDPLKFIPFSALIPRVKAKIVPAPREKVVFDTDIGADIDDQAALLYLAKEPRCDLLGVTTVGGASHVRASVASAILTSAGRGDVKVYPGVSQPLVDRRDSENGDNLLRQIKDWPHATYQPGNVAVDYLRRTIRANPGEVTLIAVGPFSNLAVLFTVDPECARLVKRVVTMGGNFSNGGGREWNALRDAYATEILVGRQRAHRVDDLTFVGNDVTGKTLMKEADARTYFDSKDAFKILGALSGDWLATRHHAVLHDPLAAVSVFHPEVCTFGYADVEVTPAGPEAGKTNVKGPVLPACDPSRRIRVATGVDRDLFYKLFTDVAGR